MEKFIPYEKLSKKKKRELDAKGRGTWAIDPAVRKSANPKAYNRRTAQKWRDDEPISVPVFVTIRFSNKTSSFIGIQLIMREKKCSLFRYEFENPHIGICRFLVLTFPLAINHEMLFQFCR